MDTILRDRLDGGDGPKYRRIVEGIEAAIGAGALTPGDKLPPVRDLAWTLGVTPGTVARAFTILGETGWVISEVGRGTFVAEAAGAPASSPAPIPTPAPVPHIRVAPETNAPLYVEMPESDDVLFAPRLADVGQIAIVREGLRRAAEAPVEQMLAYPTFDSHRVLRDAVLDWLPDDMRAAVDPTQVMLTNGGQNANLLVLQALLYDAPPVVMTEALTYTGALRAADLLGARVVPVEMDADGARPDALDAAAEATGARVFFTMPEAQNPTARATSPARGILT